MHSRPALFEPPPRLAVVLLIAILVVGGDLHPAAQAGSSQSGRAGGSVRQPVQELRLDQAIERELSAGEVHSYLLIVVAGDFVEVQVEQRGVDVALTMIGPDQQALVDLNAMDDEFRSETLTAVAKADGPHQIRIAPAKRNGAKGRYVIQLRRKAPANDADAIRVEAERMFARGRRIRDAARGATWPEALSEFDGALDRYRQTETRAGELKALIEIALTRYYMSRPDAQDAAREGERLARELGDKPALARVVKLIGNLLVARGELTEATRAFTESADLSAATGGRNAEARALNDAGIAYRRLGQAERAVALYERALPLARASRDGPLEGNVLNNLGVAYRALGESDRALDIYQQVLENRRAAGDRKGQISPLLNVGNALGRAGQYQQGLRFHLEALAAVREVGDKAREAEVLDTLGWTYYGIGDYGRALEHYGAALSLARDTGQIAEQPEILYGTARTLHRLGRTEEAIATFSDAMTVTRATRNAYVLRNLLAELSDVHRAKGNLVEAERHITEAVDLDERLRTAITSPDLRASFIAAEHDNYERLIDILQARHALDPAAGYDARSLHASERARARVLLDSLLDAQVDLRAGVEPALLERERSLQRSLNAASARLSSAIVDHRPDDERTAGSQVERLTAEYAQLQTEIRRDSPQYSAMTRPEPLALAAIQRDVLDSGTVLLEFALGRESSWLWAVTSKTVTTVRLPPRAEIEPAARSVYEHLTARQRRPREGQRSYTQRVAASDIALRREAAALSELLLGGIASRLDGEWRGLRLAIVGRGAVDYVPFSVLPVPQGATRPSGATPRPGRRPLLGDEHEIAYIPSASVIPLLRAQGGSRPDAGGRVVIFADPVYERADPRIAKTAAAAAPGSVAVSPLIARHAIGRAGLGRLPFSRAEARDIAALLPPGTVRLATDFDANRSTALGTAVRDARIVHFATHGVLDAERPAFSGLVLSLVDARGTPQNGYLRLHDIYNMRLDADLVVLSACQTALGTEIRGEGLVGLARAFMYAGAPRVVASLWQVNDQATSELMKRFYRSMLRDKLSPAAALTAAQRQMHADPRWRAPYYWAGFILLGDWR
jgi:CHAT domain-containing protein/Tfp pilus assembly protein PilF